MPPAMTTRSGIELAAISEPHARVTRLPAAELLRRSRRHPELRAPGFAMEACSRSRRPPCRAAVHQRIGQIWSTVTFMPCRINPLAASRPSNPPPMTAAFRMSVCATPTLQRHPADHGSSLRPASHFRESATRWGSSRWQTAADHKELWTAAEPIARCDAGDRSRPPDYRCAGSCR